MRTSQPGSRTRLKRSHIKNRSRSVNWSKMTIESCMRQCPFFSSASLQGPGEIVDQVLAVLTARTQSNESLGYRVALPAGPAFRRRMDPAETCGLDDQLAGAQKLLGLCAVTHHETDHRPVELHLPGGDRM